MKNVKCKLIVTTIFALIIGIAGLSYGVYSAYIVTLNGGGSIEFSAYGVDVDVDISVTGITGSPINYAGTTNLERQPSRQLILDTPWDFQNLEFDGGNTESEKELKICFEIKVRNFTDLMTYSSVTVSAINGFTIDVTGSNVYSYSYERSLGADEVTMLITIKPNSVTPANISDFSFSLNIEKTLKQETDISKFKWSTPANGTISITGNNLTSSDKEIIIPRKNGSNLVTALGNNAFYNKSYITSVIIPNSLTSIASAFTLCSALTAISLGSGVTSIGDSAFSYCRELTSITIPNKVKSIHTKAFYNCSKLTAINIEAGNSNYSSDNGVILNKNKTSVILFPPGKTSYIIPGTVTSIGERAFSYCGALTDITIPNSVTSIGNYAFEDCIKLTGITIPNSVISISNYAFSNCSAFTSVTIPNSVTTIGSNAFWRCNALTNVIIGNGVTSIGNCAFQDCSALTSVTIGSGIASIYDTIFSRCYALLDINIDAGNANYYSDDGVVLNKNKTSVILCPQGKSSYIIPSTVTIIGEDAFSDNKALTSITIPNSVNSIGYHAFYNCSKLTSITIPSKVNSIGYDAFSGCSALLAINVDSGNATYSSDDGVLLNKNKTTLIYCPGAKTSYIIPSTVTSMGNAFSGCWALTSLIIPNGVTGIGSYAFSSCSALTSVSIPSSVTSIGMDAFKGCSALASVTIPNGVESIGSSAFYNCSALASVYFERTDVFTSIGSSCFTNLKSGSVLYFKNQTVMDQFTTSHYTSSKTTKALY